MTRDYEEMRDAEIAKQRDEKLSAWLLNIAAGDKRALTDLQNTVLDSLSAESCKALFVQAVTDPAEAGAQLNRLTLAAMRTQCETEALAEVQKMEGAAKEESLVRRAEQWLWDRGVLA
jgi:hypothetical protein